jgi:ubiquitin carboxyl-terminal hydrolase 16
MPDKPVTIAAYAAGASLAAITLVYVFGPTFFIDGESSQTVGNSRKKGVVGLSNPANDCFINSVLQALAGLGDLRLYIIRELHTRKLDGPEVYNALPPESELSQGQKPAKVRELQKGAVTEALKEMLDRLNERPIYKKTISARPFIEALEAAFRTRISRNQQDAQEFLQVVAERLCEEYHVGVRARRRAARHNIIDPEATYRLEVSPPGAEGAEGEKANSLQDSDPTLRSGEPSALERTRTIDQIDADTGFPLEGKLESQIECQFCHFQYKPNPTSFVTLTLHVPQKNSTTLNSCFDGLLKTEYIDDFKCDKCRLDHAMEVKTKALEKAKSDEEAQQLDSDISAIQSALDTDPEKLPENVTLPDSKSAPKRKIARHMRITVFPKIVAIHLSRSIFDPRSSSTKNAAKVSFPERLQLGGILNQKWYKLLGIVCHKGSHNSGHYESFRRNHMYPPFSTPDLWSAYALSSRAASENPSTVPSPRLGAMKKTPDAPSPVSISPSPNESSPSLSSASLSLPSTRPSSGAASAQPSKSTTTASSSKPPTSVPNGSNNPRISGDNLSIPPDGGSKVSLNSTTTKPTTPEPSRFRRKKKPPERWWRISDDKIKECKTSDVLAMQKEVYLLFYELEKKGDDD